MTRFTPTVHPDNAAKLSTFHVCDSGLVMMATDPTRKYPLAEAGCRGVGSVRERGR